ncbi:MAG: tRNA (guanine(46)-N(7))-methyltransferase TrmB [Deltaproteobacteria bacterium]
MKPDAENATNLPFRPWSKIVSPTANLSQMSWDLEKREKAQTLNEKYWLDKGHTPIPRQLFENRSKIWLEIGAGTGGFFLELARRNPETQLVAIERCKIRSGRMLQKFEKSKLTNISGFRGNAIPALITGIPDESVERIYILYPCPWPKNAQRKNRWYLHTVMTHLVRILKPQGLLIWASDQEFYIREATFVSESKHQLKTLFSGELAPNCWNDLDLFPEGRTSFESKFLSHAHPCYELISQK